jgi:multidrug efflux pump subunit AcrB
LNITQFAIEKNRITFVALIVIVLAGMSAYRTMSRAEDPGFIIRTALVLTYFPGASPERVEMLVTDKLEKVIQEIPELDFVNSISRTGVSQVMVNIKEEHREMRPIWDNLRRKVDRAKGDLPDGIIGPIVDDEFGDVFGIVIGMTGEGYSYAELKDVADDVRDELLRISSAAKVEIYGAQEERVFVEYNNARLAELGISPRGMESILESRNIINPGGDVVLGVQRIVLEPTGNFLSVEDLRRTLIQIPRSNELVPLEDIARVYRGYIDPTETKMTTSGVPSLGLAVSMQEGGNIIKLGEEVKALIHRLEALYPIGIDFDLIAFQPLKVEQKVDAFIGNLIQAISIVLLVMLITLGVRTGLVVATLIPVTMVLSFLLMSAFKIGLDQISLAALIIALGMLVDNAIVMSESIMVQMAHGKPGKQAAIDSAKELRIPLLISSLTTSAAFLPIFLAESAVGEYTASLFKVVTIALLSSWVLALTMTAMLCARFLKVKQKEESYEGRFYRLYRRTLLRALRHPWVTVAVALVVFLVAMQGFRLIPNIFFPGNDAPIFTAELELPLGTRIERTEEVVRGIEAFMRENYLLDQNSAEDEEGIVNWGTFIGQGAPRFYLAYAPEQLSSNYAIMVVNATSRKYIDRILPEIEEYCENSYPDLQPTLRPLLLGPPVDRPVEVRISGKDPEVLFGLVNKVKVKLTEVPGAKLIDDDWGPRLPKVLIKVNEARARRAGVTNEDVATSLQALLTGFETTEYREDDKVIPVTLRSVASERYDIENMHIYSQSTGGNVPIRQVADAELAWEPAKVLRRNRLKTVTLSSQLEPGFTALEVVGRLDEWLSVESESWPIGYNYEYGGEIESSVKANASIGEKLPIAVLIIVLLLVGQFNSFRRPLIILLTIPLGLIGVVVGLLLAKSYFGFITLLGVVALAGIVINNAIVLLQRIKLEIEVNGLDPPRAVVMAAQRRMRPILLTTMTTCGGLIPLWVGGGPMFEPMAITIFFGLLFATMLTLGIVPVLYSLFFRVKYKDFVY